MPLTRVYHAQKPSFWQRQHANLACCREPNLIFAFLPRTIAQTALRWNQSLPMSFRGVKRRGNPLNRNENTFGDWQTPHLFSQSLPRREFALSVQTRAKTPATISPNYLLGESWAGHPHPILRLRKISAYSKRTYIRNVLIRRRNWSRKATTVANTELDG